QGNGLNILGPKDNIVHYSHAGIVPLSAKTVWSIFKDKSNTIWLGTREQGLIQFDKRKGEIKKYRHATDNGNTLPSNNIRAIAQADKGNLWIGTEGDGISYFDVDRETFTTYQHIPEANSLSGNNIKSL